MKGGLGAGAAPLLLFVLALACTASAYSSPFEDDTSSVSSTVNDLQYNVLKQFYDDAGGTNWTLSAGWGSVFHDYCSAPWYGIKCSNNAVIGIDLPNNNLRGSISPALGQLPALSFLYLLGNVLTGPIPEELGNVSSLTYITLQHNELTGTVPTALFQLPKLNTLALGFNQLEGELDGLIYATGLSALILGSNGLSGTLPDVFDLMYALTALDLSDNLFTGELPESMSSLTTLAALSLQNNSLSGTLPASWSQLVALTNLDISYNEFSGALPDLSTLSSLQVFRAAGNQFNGSVPVWADCDLETCALEGNSELACQNKCAGNRCELQQCTSCFITCRTSADCVSAGGPCVACNAEGNCDVPLHAPPPPTSSSGAATTAASTTATGSSTAPKTTGTKPHPKTKSPPTGLIFGLVIALLLLCVGALVAFAIVRMRRSQAQYKRMTEAAEKEEPAAGGSASGSGDHTSSHGSFATAQQHTRELSVRFDAPSSGRRADVFTFVIDTRLEVIRWSELEITGEIGRGGYGTVLRARRGHTDVAVKVLRDIVHPDQVQAFVEEASILSDLKHPNIVLLMGVCVELHHMSLVTEFLQGGDLHALVYPSDDTLYSPTVTGGAGQAAQAPLTRRSNQLQILYQTAVGLEYLHNRGISHRDIKLRNILLDDKTPQTAKLADFGLSGLKRVDLSGGGTEFYSAPEVLAGQVADKRSDIFSFGVVMFEVLCARKPRTAEDVDSMPESIPVDLAVLLRTCLAAAPSARPQITHITTVLEGLTRRATAVSASGGGGLAIPKASFSALPTESPSRQSMFGASAPSMGLGDMRGPPGTGPRSLGKAAGMSSAQPSINEQR